MTFKLFLQGSDTKLGLHEGKKPLKALTMECSSWEWNPFRSKIFWIKKGDNQALELKHELESD